MNVRQLTMAPFRPGLFKVRTVIESNLVSFNAKKVNGVSLVHLNLCGVGNRFVSWLSPPTSVTLCFVAKA